MIAASSIEPNAHLGDEDSNSSNEDAHHNEGESDKNEAAEEMELLQLAVKVSLEKFSLYPQKLRGKISDLEAQLQQEKGSKKQMYMELQDTLENQAKLKSELETENKLKLAASKAAEDAKDMVVSLNCELVNEIQLKVKAINELEDAKTAILELNTDLENNQQVILSAWEEEMVLMAQLDRVQTGRFKLSNEFDRLREKVKDCLQKCSKNCADLEEELRCSDGSPSIRIGLDEEQACKENHEPGDNTGLRTAPKMAIQGHQPYLEKDLGSTTASNAAAQGHQSTMIMPREDTYPAEASYTWTSELQRIQNSIIALLKTTQLQPQMEARVANLEDQLHQEKQLREQAEREIIDARETAVVLKEDLEKEKIMKEDALVNLCELKEQLDEVKKSYENDLGKCNDDLCELSIEFDKARKTYDNKLQANIRSIVELIEMLNEIELAGTSELDPKQANLETHIKKLQATRDNQLKEIETLKATINSKEGDIKKLRQNDERLKLENKRLAEKTAGQNAVVKENKMLKEKVSSLTDDLNAAKKRSDRCGMVERELIDKTTAADEALTQSLADRGTLDEEKAAQKEIKAQHQKELAQIEAQAMTLRSKVSVLDHKITVLEKENKTLRRGYAYSTQE